jgi:CheY-like chemotaxis protein
LGGKTILVVEDNAMNQIVKMITKKWLNTTVLYANNGQEGLDVLKLILF